MLPVPKGLRNLLPTWQDLKDCRFAFVNGSVVGFLIGVLPGAGSTIASFISYGIEKAVSRQPRAIRHRRDRGRGRAGGRQQRGDGRRARAAAHARHSGLRHDGDPAGGAGAVGLQARAALHPENPTLFWGLVASMYIGNVMLLILNLPLVPVFAQMLRAAGLRAVSR